MYKHGKKAKYDHQHDAVFQIHEYNVDIELNHIYLMGEETYGVEMESQEPGVEYVMANRFIRNLNICMHKNQSDPIIIFMKTCGGFWEEGMSIHNAIKSCPNPVTIVNYTHARSMSSIIFQAANKRVMMPDSYFMFHEGTWGFSGTVKQARSEYEQLIQTNSRMMEIYIDAMKRNGKYKDKSSKWIYNNLKQYMLRKEEVYLNSKTTVEFGLADEVFGSNGKYDWDSLIQYTDEQLSR